VLRYICVGCAAPSRAHGSRHLGHLARSVNTSCCQDPYLEDLVFVFPISRYTFGRRGTFQSVKLQRPDRGYRGPSLRKRSNHECRTNANTRRNR
jgi:hypothetical protein